MLAIITNHLAVSGKVGVRKSMRTSILLLETSFLLHIYGPRALTLAQVLVNGLISLFYKNLYQPFDIIHTRSQSPVISSGACQRLQEPLLFLRKPFPVIHTRVQSPDMAPVPVNKIYSGECPFYKNFKFYLRKSLHDIHTKAQSPLVLLTFSIKNIRDHIP